MIRRSVITSALRKVWLYSETRRQALSAAHVSRGSYRCASCQSIQPRKQVQVDHIEAVGRFVDWNTYVERLFCPIYNLQVLCLECHKAKTKKGGK